MTKLSAVTTCLTPLALSGLFLLTACGGGSAGSASGNAVTPVTLPGTSAKNRATVSLSFTVPQNDSQASASSANRTPKFISPGQNNITLIVDGTKVLNAAVISAGLASPTTSPDGNTVVTVAYAGSGSYYTYTIGIDTIPGKHRIGVEILGNAPQVILSEAQNVYSLQPGSNPAATLTLMGVLSSGYIECANGPVDNTNCSSSFTPDATVGTGGVYTLTAIGADFESFPISSQGSTTFDNGGFTVVETDGNGILTLTQPGAPFTAPGTQLTGAPSGGYYVPALSTYGQSFEARCVKLGTATLSLQNAASGPNTPLVGETYTTYNPANQVPTVGNYPGAGTLATGNKIAGNPNYHSGQNPNAVTTLMSINCDANLNLTIN